MPFVFIFAAKESAHQLHGEGTVLAKLKRYPDTVGDMKRDFMLQQQLLWVRAAQDQIYRRESFASRQEKP